MNQTLISVDLDDLGCYHAIHGLPPPREDVVLSRCLSRLLELFAGLDLRVTLFVIGRSLDTHPVLAEQLRDAVARGHELGNHSDAHAYDLTRWPAERIEADLERCDARLRGLGATPQGFRAPGYLHDARLLGIVAGLGYRYDSSRLPSLPYFAAKTGVIAWHRLRGRRSGSQLAGPGSFIGARRPHRLRSGLWELPMSAPWGFPLIGTTLLHGPEPIAAALHHLATAQPYLHLELHALDLVDPEHDPIDPRLRRLQPEIAGAPLPVKRDRLMAILRARSLMGQSARLCDALPSAAA